MLADPGRQFHALDLVAAESGQVAAAERRGAAGLSHSGPGDAGAMLDARAKEAYRRRLAEIDEEVEQAHAFGDTERAAQADAERDSSFESCRVRSASAVATDGQRQRPSGHESA